MAAPADSDRSASSRADASAVERSRARRAAAKPEAKGKKTVLYIGCAVVALVAAVFVYMKVTAKETLTLAIDWPQGKPGGPAVEVGHAVKDGDQFTMAVVSHTGIVLGDAVDPMQGMTLDAKMAWEHAVAPREGGLRSTVTVRLENSSGTLPLMPGRVTSMLSGPRPLRFLVDREADGAPVAGTGRVEAAGAEGRGALEYVLSGMTDLSTNYLPPRVVHLGDTWDLKECATLGEIVEAIRFLATLKPSPAGFPSGGWKGSVGAEAIEPKNGEPCVRLKLALEIRMEGDVHKPAEPGWLSAVAKVEGSAWVAQATGVLWALETRSEVKSTYDTGRARDERRAKQNVVGTTSRRN